MKAIFRSSGFALDTFFMLTLMAGFLLEKELEKSHLLKSERQILLARLTTSVLASSHHF